MGKDLNLVVDVVMVLHMISFPLLPLHVNILKMIHCSLKYLNYNFKVVLSNCSIGVVNCVIVVDFLNLYLV